MPQAPLDGELCGAEQLESPALRRSTQRQRHQLVGLHNDQQVGVPQQAILACETVVQVQNGSETGLWHGSVHRTGESGPAAAEQCRRTLMS